MSETYRPPKAVLAEIDLPATLTAADVAALRHHDGETGIWAGRICTALETRAATIKEITMDDRAPMDEPVDAEPVETPPADDCAAVKILEAIAALIEVAESTGVICDDDADEAPMEANAADPDAETRRSLLDSCEKRSFRTEVRAVTGDDGTVRLRGYAAVFDQEATGLPFREVIRRGAFAESLGRGDEVYLLVNHNTDELPLARRSSGTLTVTEDDHGLLVEANLDPANPRAAELISALTRNDVSEMSFAFRVPKDGEVRNEDGLRELVRADLFETSVTTWGAYNQTEVGLRTAEADDLQARWLAAKWQHARRTH